MNPLGLIASVTAGPWYLDLGAIAGALTALGVIYQMGVRPVARAVWLAIKAAPLIADGIGKLVLLVEGDVLGRLDAGSARFEAHEARLDNHETRIVALEDYRDGGSA